MGKINIQIKFQTIGIMLYNFKIIINDLKLKFQMFISPNFCSTNVIFINSNIFKIAKIAVQNSIKLKFKIVNHQNDFPI